MSSVLCLNIFTYFAILNSPRYTSQSIWWREEEKVTKMIWLNCCKLGLYKFENSHETLSAYINLLGMLEWSSKCFPCIYNTHLPLHINPLQYNRIWLKYIHRTSRHFIACNAIHMSSFMAWKIGWLIYRYIMWPFHMFLDYEVSSLYN